MEHQIALYWADVHIPLLVHNSLGIGATQQFPAHS
jgi:hypothetical protein